MFLVPIKFRQKKVPIKLPSFVFFPHKKKSHFLAPDETKHEFFCRHVKKITKS
jgi:hypothetical protein